MSPGVDLTPEETAGFLLWFCGHRACAIVHATARALPEVARHLVARTEARYTAAVAEEALWAR